MKIVPIQQKSPTKADISFLSQDNIEKVQAFHASFPMYQETPLHSLPGLAGRLGVRGFYVKDESPRFGLNAFKALGGSYAIGRYLANRLGIPLSELPFSRMVSDEIRAQLGSVTFITATDGNHGRGVAWTANQLKQSAVIYLPKGTKQERVDNIRKENAEAIVTDMNYDDTVRLARKRAEENGWIMVQDTTLPGYRDIPRWIMEGYGTMAREAYQRLPEAPTHIFLQAGVGSMAGAVTGFFANVYPKEQKPIITILEPETADCIFRTAKAADGKLHFARGEMRTMMAGLACGEPCDISWDILESCGDFAAVCSDEAAALGMRTLAHPAGKDPVIISGESGASTTGFAVSLLSDIDSYGDFCNMLHLDKNSVILCFSTEGATDRENYRRIVGEGILP